MKEPLMRIGRSQMRVSSRRSSETRLHLNRAGTDWNCNCDHVCAPDSFRGEKFGHPGPNSFWAGNACLRRTPDQSGFNSWVSYLTANPSDFRTMVNGFLNSTEYRLRFGP